MKVVRIGADRNTSLEANFVTVEINGALYRLSESVDHKLIINAERLLSVFPRYSNEIEILSHLED